MKNKTGIALATEIAEASKNSMVDFEVMMLASKIFHLAPSDEMSDLLFKYSGTLTAHVATRITNILMSESDFNDMVDEVQMFDEIERDVLGGNN